MKYAFPLAAVIALVLIALIAVQIPGMQYLFGVVIPYLAMALFLGGFCYRIIHWAKSPVPFKIPTTCGQGYSLPWIKYDKLEAPVNTAQVVARMFLEIFLFRSLWRNTKATVYDGPKLTYESSKWLWLFGILFHYSFLVIVIRHMRMFLDPVPWPVSFLETADSLLQIGAPTMYTTDVTIVLALLFLFGRRLMNPQVRYISLANDYFPLFLIFGIVFTGILMRYFPANQCGHQRHQATRGWSGHVFTDHCRRNQFAVLCSPLSGVHSACLLSFQQAHAYGRCLPQPDPKYGKRFENGPPHQSLEPGNQTALLRGLRGRVP